MTQSTPHRRSPSSHGPKPKSRPVLHRRGTSGVSLSISKLGSGHSRGVSRNRDDDADFDMAASFLNFCAMCERQITIPSNTVLYCSESCRRKDSCKPLSHSMPSMTNMSSMNTSTTPPTSPPLSPRTIVAPMTPTRVPSNPIPSIRIPTEPHDSKTDLDPTEWKPVILSTGSGGTSLASSDAWNYLSQFHGGGETMLTRRSHRSTASLPALVGGTSNTTTPSVASSYSSTASDYLGSMYENAQRPLPPRHNPYFSSSAATKGVGLVFPTLHQPPTSSPSRCPTRALSSRPAVLYGETAMRSRLPSSLGLCRHGPRKLESDDEIRVAFYFPTFASFGLALGRGSILLRYNF